MTEPVLDERLDGDFDRPDSPPPSSFALLERLDTKPKMRRSPSGRRLSRAPSRPTHIVPPHVTFQLIDWYEGLHRALGEALSGAKPSADTDEPPTQFGALDLLIDVGASLWQRWLAATKEAPGSASGGGRSDEGEADPSLRIDHAAHRYPCCLVWTPIHPLTWLCPYIGHVGLGDREGVIHDFAGRHVGRDAMAFGWPARYLQLSPHLTADWAAEVAKAADAFERVEYCH